jgi:hypothetical protein
MRMSYTRQFAVAVVLVGLVYSVPVWAADASNAPSSELKNDVPATLKTSKVVSNSRGP